MKGTIAMEFNGPKTTIKVNVKDVSTADKCAVVDNLLESLNVTGFERLTILAAVAANTNTDTNKEETEHESRRFRNQNI